MTFLQCGTRFRHAARVAVLVPIGLVLAGGVAPRRPIVSDSPAADGSGIPFGLFGMKGRMLIEPYTSAMQAAQPDGILADLASARARGARIVVNFAGGAGKLTDGDGRFDYGAWKARLDRFLPMTSQLNAYVADGTLLATMLVDEPLVAKHWGGEPIPFATLDTMSQYAKSLFPGLITVIGEEPSRLQGYRWRSLDAAWAQYAARKSAIGTYVSSEAGAARAAGLGLIVGLNISKGGDGSSGFGRTREWSMTGDEIATYGHALLDAPGACAFISWDGRASVIGRPDVAAALSALAAAARSHPSASCARSAGG